MTASITVIGIGPEGVPAPARDLIARAALVAGGERHLAAHAPAGAALAGTGRRLIVAERLGAPDERVVEGKPEEIAEKEFQDPNVLLALDPHREVGSKAVVWPPRTPDEWALADDAFEHRAGLITK